jgi:hypothetical protein
MARSKGWHTVGGLLLGIGLATVFWLYGPFLPRMVSRQVEEAVKGQAARVAAPAGKGGEALQVRGLQAAGFRYQLVTDGKETFLADLKEGRVWRYYRQTREGGSQKEEEGFLPLPFFFGGKKYPQAGDVEQ